MRRFLNPIICFGVLTFVLLGLVPLVDIFLASGGGDFAEIAQRASEKTGLVWTSNLLVVVRMCIAEPALTALLVGSVVPALAAVLTLTFMQRPNRWKEFWGRLNPLRATSVRTAVVNYGLIFVILVPTLVLVLYLRPSTGGQYTGAVLALDLGAVLMIFSLALLDQSALLEELGWRGFAVPELQRKITSPLCVAILVGIFWGLWHLPRDITTGVIERLGAMQYVALYLPSFLLGTISVSIIEALTPYHPFTKNSLLALVAIVIVIVGRSSLGRRSSKSG